MAISDDLNRIHERIDDLGTEMREGFATLGQKFTEHLIDEAPCRANCVRMTPIVIGKNGDPSIGQRVDEARAIAVEAQKAVAEHRGTSIRFVLAAVGVAGSIIGAIVGGIFRWLAG